MYKNKYPTFVIISRKLGIKRQKSKNVSDDNHMNLITFYLISWNYPNVRCVGLDLIDFSNTNSTDLHTLKSLL